ncbi:MAG: hypothetical protein IJU54_01050 [Alphaproteobacteria bacterium]|nr:hypothetical protein [Alphaproteobacteria bacterium]
MKLARGILLFRDEAKLLPKNLHERAKDLFHVRNDASSIEDNIIDELKLDTTIDYQYNKFVNKYS